MVLSMQIPDIVIIGEGERFAEGCQLRPQIFGPSLWSAGGPFLLEN